MTLDETAQLVRHTAKGLGLTLRKIIAIDGHRTMDFRGPKRQQPEEERFVRAELLNGMKMSSIRVFPGTAADVVREQLEWAAEEVGLRIKG